MVRRLFAAACTAALVLSLSATAALGGEVTGNGDPTPVQSYRAKSICSFSGRNDGEPPAGRKAAHVQSWGQETKESRAAAAAMGFHPGDACNGHSGLIASGGGE